MNAIIYGPEQPKISFTQSHSGGITFKIENSQVVYFDEKNPDITWVDLCLEKWAWPRTDDPEAINRFHKCVESLAQLTATEAERKFFLGYVSFVEKNFRHDLWGQPALIPQVWVNWIHYDNKDANRAKRAQKEPFRVDFVMKHSYMSETLMIIEIDGSSHFSSMDAYTQHLKKDRWLRSQRWDVYRISNQEVEEEFDNLDNFFWEVLGFVPF